MTLRMSRTLMMKVVTTVSAMTMTATDLQLRSALLRLLSESRQNSFKILALIGGTP